MAGLGLPAGPAAPEVSKQGTLGLKHELLGHGAQCAAALVSPLGNLVATATSSGSKLVRLWDAHTGQCLHQLRGPGGTITSFSFSPPGGELLAAASFNGSVWVWDTASGRLLHKLRGQVCDFLQGAQGGACTLLTTTFFGRIELWEGKSGKCTASLRKWGMNCVKLTGDWETLVVGTMSGELLLYEPGTGKHLRTLGPAHKASVQQLCFAKGATQHLMASCSGDKTVQVWDTKAWELRCVLEGHTKAVCAAAFSHGDSGGVPLLATGSADCSVRVWDLALSKEIKVLTGHKSLVNMIAWAPSEGDRRILSASFDNTVRAWDAISGACLAVVVARVPCTSALPLWEAHGNSLATVTAGREAGLWDLGSIPDGPSGMPSGMLVSDGAELAEPAIETFEQEQRKKAKEQRPLIMAVLAVAGSLVV